MCGWVHTVISMWLHSTFMNSKQQNCFSCCNHLEFRIVQHQCLLQQRKEQYASYALHHHKYQFHLHFACSHLYAYKPIQAGIKQNIVIPLHWVYPKPTANNMVCNTSYMGIYALGQLNPLICPLIHITPPISCCCPILFVLFLSG